MIALFFQFSMRHARLRPWRTLGTVLGIALGVAMIVATTVTSDAALASFREMITTAAGKAQLQVLPAASSGFEESVLEDVAETPGVVGAYPVVTGITRIMRDDVEIDALPVYGIDTARDQEVRAFDIVDGAFLGQTGAQLILPVQWAEEHDVAVDDNLGLLTADGVREFRVAALVSDTGVGTTNAGQFLFTNIASAQRIFAREGRYDQIDVVLGEDEDVGVATTVLQDRLGSGFSVEPPAGRGKDIDDSLRSISLMLSLASSISLIIGLLLIYNNMTVSVEERRHHIAMLRAFGLRRRKVMVLVLAEAGVLGFLGGALGTVLGIGIARAMAAAAAGFTTSMNRVALTKIGAPSGVLLLGVLAGTVAAILASLPPATAMLRVQPLSGLVPADAVPTSRGRATVVASWALFAVGVLGFGAFLAPKLSGVTHLDFDAYFWVAIVSLLALVVGVIMLLPGLFRALAGHSRVRSVTLRLSLDNLARNPGRTSATAAGMMVALAMMVAMSAQADATERYTSEWLREMFGWDMIVSSSFLGASADVPLDPEVGAELRGVEGVEHVAALRFARVDYGGTKVALGAYEMDELLSFTTFPLLDGDAEQFESRMCQPDWLAVSTITANRFDLGAGDSVELPTPDGSARFRIAGVVKDQGMDTGTFYIDQATYERLWGDARVDAYDVKLAEGYDVAVVGKVIEDGIGDRWHLTVKTRAELISDTLELIDQFWVLTDTLVYIAVFVAAAGIMNAALITLLQRTREISLLRALGGRRRHVRRLLLLESVLVGAVGAGSGVLIGTALGRALTATQSMSGVPWEFQMPWAAIGMAFVLGVGLSALGSLLPARVATRTDIVSGLRYE